MTPLEAGRLAAGSRGADASPDLARGGARTLLACGAAAGPLYVAVAAIQALTREGFDVTRHAVSLLTLGDLGWIQIANFIVTGSLVVAGAVGLGRALGGGRGGTWGPILIGAYGVGLIGSGIFVPDAGFGFPPGTPPGPPAAFTTHGTLHFVVGGVAFLALIAACFVFARRFATSGERGWSAFSAATGVLFFAAFFAIAALPDWPGATVGLGLAVVLVSAWLSALSLRLRRALAGSA